MQIRRTREEKDKYLQWKTRKFVASGSLKLSRQTGLHFSTGEARSHGTRLVTVSVHLGSVLKLFQEVTEEAASGNTAAVRAGFGQGPSAAERGARRNSTEQHGTALAPVSLSWFNLRFSTFRLCCPTQSKCSHMGLYLQLNLGALSSLAIVFSMGSRIYIENILIFILTAS